MIILNKHCLLINKSVLFIFLLVQLVSILFSCWFVLFWIWCWFDSIRQQPLITFVIFVSLFVSFALDELMKRKFYNRKANKMYRSNNMDITTLYNLIEPIKLEKSCIMIVFIVCWMLLLMCIFLVCLCPFAIIKIQCVSFPFLPKRLFFVCPLIFSSSVYVSFNKLHENTMLSSIVSSMVIYTRIKPMSSVDVFMWNLANNVLIYVIIFIQLE